MECFLILGFMIRNAETILEMIDRFFHIYTDFVGIFPFHFRAHKFQGGKFASQMRFKSCLS